MIVNVIPLAWKWQRFVDEWYILPKPLIDIKWEKMIFKAFKSMPIKSDKNIFVCLKDHIDRYSIDKLIIDLIPKSIITSDSRPTWQAGTTALIKDYVALTSKKLTSNEMTDTEWIDTQIGIIKNRLSIQGIQMSDFSYIDSKTIEMINFILNRLKVKNLLP